MLYSGFLHRVVEDLIFLREPGGAMGTNDPRNLPCVALLLLLLRSCGLWDSLGTAGKAHMWLQPRVACWTRC